MAKVARDGTRRGPAGSGFLLGVSLVLMAAGCGGPSGPKPVPVRSVIPTAYGESASSGLRVTVKPGGNTGPEFSFDLRTNDPSKGK